MSNKDRSYYRNERGEIIKLIPSGPHAVLDVGCGEGILGRNLKCSGKASEVWGIELVADVAEVAKSNLDVVFSGDVEDIVYSEARLASKKFDYIICADVLEHLYDPWRVLHRLSSMLKKSGRIIVSVPNVRHWSVLCSLLFLGKWEYKKQGIMDQTHLRFFTKGSLEKMASLSDMDIEYIKPLIYRKIDKLGHYLGCGVLDGFFAFQWFAVLKKAK